MSEYNNYNKVVIRELINIYFNHTNGVIPKFIEDYNNNKDEISHDTMHIFLEELDKLLSFLNSIATVIDDFVSVIDKNMTQISEYTMNTRVQSISEILNSNQFKTVINVLSGDLDNTNSSINPDGHENSLLNHTKHQNANNDDDYKTEDIEIKRIENDLMNNGWIELK